jgi:hypothetical protein
MLNDSGVVAEVLAIHETYEAALVANDVAVLDQMFWHSADAVRFGVVESLYGFDEVAAFRKARPAIDLARTVLNRKVVTFGTDTAITTIEFDRNAGGTMRRGRQTQVWRRLEEGWRIVSAHVSFVLQPASYIDTASALVGLTIPPEYRAGVELNVNRSRAIAQPLLEFDLPESVEMAPVFQP